MNDAPKIENIPPFDANIPEGQIYSLAREVSKLIRRYDMMPIDQKPTDRNLLNLINSKADMATPVSMPTINENYTYRGNSTLQPIMTDSLITYEGDGSKVTDDHLVGLDERLPDLIYTNIGDPTPTVTNYPIGTLWVNKIGGTNGWVAVAPQLNSKQIHSLVYASDGYFYGGTSAGELFRWQVGDSVWTQVAPSASKTYITALTEYNNKIYAMAGGGWLLEWNGVDAWSVVGGGSSPALFSLCTHNSTLYASGNYNGILYEWNGVDTLTAVSGTDTQIRKYALCSYSYTNKLYASSWESLSAPPTGNDGALDEWNGVDAFVEVAPQFEIEHGTTTEGIMWIGEYNNYIHGITSSGKLLRWNDVDAWEQLAPRLDSIYPKVYYQTAAIVCDGELYVLCQTAASPSYGYLLKYNGVDAWEIMISGYASSNYGLDQIATDDTNIYASGSSNGVLYRADLYNEGESNIYINISDAWVKCVDKVSLSTTINGVLPLINGGTNSALVASNGGIVYSNSDSLEILSGISTANRLLMSGASTIPIWSHTSYPSSVATNSLLYASTNNTISAMATSANRVLITTGNATPILSTNLPSITVVNIEINGDLNHDGSNIGFFGGSPVSLQTALTTSLATITCSSPSVSDYAISNPTTTSPYGFVNLNEALTLVKVVANLQTRLNELETKLQAYNFIG